MKTPEEIKKGLAACSADECHGQHEGCTYQDQLFCTMRMCEDALAYIQQLESTYSQLSKALCDKENATLDEMLDAVDQLHARIEGLEFGEQLARQREEETGAILKETRSELEQIRRERDAAVRDINFYQSAVCFTCSNHIPPEAREDWRTYCKRHGRLPEAMADRSPTFCGGYEWRGICPENTKEETDV